MDANPFQTARGYLDSTPRSKWGAIITSILASLCIVALFPLLYLFVDLLVWQGRAPSFASLPPADRAAFESKWEQLSSADPAINETLKLFLQSGPAYTPDSVKWELRWQAATHAWLTSHVSEEAAEAYLPLRVTADSPGPFPVTTESIGLLSTVIRNQQHWPGRFLASAARMMPWTWRGGEGNSPTGNLLLGLLATAMGVLVLRGVLLNLSAYCAAACTQDAVTRLRRSLFTHSYRLPAVTVKPEAQDEAGQLLAYRVEQIQDGFLSWLTFAFRCPALIVTLIVVSLLVHPWLAASLLLISLIVWLIAGQVVNWFRHDARQAARRAESRLELLRESLQITLLVKGYLMDRFGQTRVERLLSDLGRLSWRKQRGEAVSRSALLTVALLAGLGMLYIAARVVLAGELSLAGLAVLGLALTTIAYTLNRWMFAMSRITRARAAAADVLEFLDRRGEPGHPIDAEFLQPLSQRLDLFEVSVREAGTGRMVLEHVTMTIPAGTKAALVYADATEAHAVAHLIARFFDPTAGEVRIDGKNLRWTTTESLRAQVCLVLEQSLTFSDTVANNIGCGDPGYSLPQIIEAAKLAHAHQFIQALNYGYETRIGAGGVTLRPGERFRIALARALLRDPSLLVIEEPVEPLDPDSLALIDDCLARTQTGRTLLFLARRPATVKNADRVFVLQHGKLAASGTHDDLIGSSELYRLLHFKQNLTTTAGPA